MDPQLRKYIPSRVSRLSQLAFNQMVRVRLDFGNVEELISDDDYRLLLDAYYGSDDFAPDVDFLK